MAALHSRCGHYIFILWFFLLSFFPLLISAIADWMSTIPWCGLSANLGCRSETCCTQLAENTGCKKSPKIHHLCTIAQVCQAISSQLRHISTVWKNLLNSNISSTCPHNTSYGELRPTSGWDRFVSLGHSSWFQRVSRLGSVTAQHCSMWASAKLRRWTEGATCIWQGGHHFGLWHTF